MENDLAMIFKKNRNKSVSVTHESKKTVVIVDGKEIDVSGNEQDVDLLSILKSKGVNMDLIPETMLSTISSSLETNTVTSNANSKVKVDCSSCNRTVSYGKGNCFYCGNTLVLPRTVESGQTTNEVDARYLNTNEVESKDTVADSDVNYIDRLKDI